MNSVADPTANMTDADLADHYYERRADPGDWGEPESIEKPMRLDVTISVRFSADEIALLRQRAEAAGDRVTAYIRRAALEAEEPPLDRGVATTLLSEAERVVERLGDLLHLTARASRSGQANEKPAVSTRRSKTAAVTPIDTRSSQKQATKRAETTKKAVPSKIAAERAPATKTSTKSAARKRRRASP